MTRDTPAPAHRPLGAEDGQSRDPGVKYSSFHPGGVEREKLIEAVADALAQFEQSFGYSIRLTRLVDGESTYELAYDDCGERLEFPSHADASQHVAGRRAEEQARAVLAALPLIPTPGGEHG